MPILANLSRRLHLLTTDAKPDPPRINIPNDSNNSSTINSNLASPISSEVLDNTSSNISDKSRDHSRKAQNNLLHNNETTSSNSTTNDTGKKSNPRPKKKTSSNQSKNIINYNIVNSNGVKIGETITYVCNVNQYCKNEDKINNKSDFSSTTQTTSVKKTMSESVKVLSMSKKELTMQDMFLIKTHIDNSWRDIFKSLGYSKGQLDQFEESHKSKGMDEMIYQILLDWKRENGKDAHIGLIVKILWKYHQYECVERLATADIM